MPVSQSVVLEIGAGHKTHFQNWRQTKNEFFKIGAKRKTIVFRNWRQTKHDFFILRQGRAGPTVAKFERGNLACACPSAGRHVDFGANMCVASDANTYSICDVASVANAYPICDVASDAKRIPHLRRGYSRKRIPHLRRGSLVRACTSCMHVYLHIDRSRSDACARVACLFSAPRTARTNRTWRVMHECAQSVGCRYRA